MLPAPLKFAAIVGGAILYILLQAAPADAGLFGRSRSNCGANGRPCGPGGPINFLIPQQVAGANFRYACARHDRCYRIPGINRQYCDRVFYRDLMRASDRSYFPPIARTYARMYYFSVKVGGATPFRQAQGLVGF
ncbi:hypothetical protein [Stratiformator vulcanicus]|uniref:Prokaryotic phospholipase A2 n=1 Tax=Stratiformator vulcanicus TaxID=2527980 RepID=A0A517R6Z7_9PLAN|nr:hypothetical protein [Stratiformator vulcanicus]QDT39664.1 hypothetical protein Pan189_40730 [Stratiformator vulcanicus]